MKIIQELEKQFLEKGITFTYEKVTSRFPRAEALSWLTKGGRMVTITKPHKCGYQMTIGLTTIFENGTAYAVNAVITTYPGIMPVPQQQTI